jgi:hypothetical protein
MVKGWITACVEHGQHHNDVTLDGKVDGVCHRVCNNPYLRASKSPYPIVLPTRRKKNDRTAHDV